jgi:hypothetical protein
MQLKMEEDGFVQRMIFSDEATFLISGKVKTRKRATTRTDSAPA